MRLFAILYAPFALSLLSLNVYVCACVCVCCLCMLRLLLSMCKYVFDVRQRRLRTIFVYTVYIYAYIYTKNIFLWWDLRFESVSIYLYVGKNQEDAKKDKNPWRRFSYVCIVALIYKLTYISSMYDSYIAKNRRRLIQKPMTSIQFHELGKIGIYLWYLIALHKNSLIFNFSTSSTALPHIVQPAVPWNSILFSGTNEAPKLVAKEKWKRKIHRT